MTDASRSLTTSPSSLYIALQGISAIIIRGALTGYVYVYHISLTKQVAVQTDGIIDTLVFLLEVSQCMAPGWVHVPARGLPHDIKPISAFHVQTTALQSLRMMCNASCLELEAALCANQAVEVGLRASYLLLLMLAWHFFTRCLRAARALDCLSASSAVAC